MTLAGKFAETDVTWPIFVFVGGKPNSYLADYSAQSEYSVQP